MNDSQVQEQINAAEAYEFLFVPALFQQWAPIVTKIANIQPGQRVLDVACGTGVLAREAARIVGSAGHIAGLDISPGMVEVARRITPSIEWKQGPAEAMPYPDRSFDVVVSQFGLMFFSAKEKAMREMQRVLVDDGTLTVAVWDALEANPAYADEVALLERMAGQEAADAVAAPFLMGEKSELLELAIQSGMETAVVTTLPGTAIFPNVRTLVEADLRGWLPVMGVFLEEAQIQDILAEAEVALRSYVTEEKRVEFPVSAHILSAVKP